MKDHKTLLFEKFLTAGHGYISDDGDTLRIKKFTMHVYDAFNAASMHLKKWFGPTSRLK